MDFGKYLKQIRESRSLSVRELAKRSNVSHAHISQIETGQRGAPKPDTIKKLAEGLNWDYDELMREAGYGNASNDQSPNDPSPSEKKDKLAEGLTREEQSVLEEIRKHPKANVFFNDLASDPQGKVRKLIKMWDAILNDIENDDDEEPED